MSKKPSIFQPDHVGRPTPNKPGPALTRTHADGRAIEHAKHVARGMERQYSGGIDPRIGGREKYQSNLVVHGGMVRQTKNGPAFGGDHASAMDSLTGLAVVPGSVKSAPGWGNAGARSGHPLAKPPGGKNLSPVQPSPGMRSRVGETFNDAAPGQNAKRKPDSEMLRSLGKQILAEATCSSDDAMARPDWGIGTLPPVVRSK